MVPQCVTSTFKPGRGVKWVFSLQTVAHVSDSLHILFYPQGHSCAPLLTFNFFGELDPVRVGEWAGLLVNVVNV